MQARMFCPKHGKLDFDDVAIKKGMPICRKCQSALEFGKVLPRRVEKREKKKRTKRKGKTKRGK